MLKQIFNRKRELNYMLRNDDRKNVGWHLITDIERYEYEMKEYQRMLENINALCVLDSSTESLSFFCDLLRKDCKYNSLLEIHRGNSQDRYIYPFHKMNETLLGYEMTSRTVKVDLCENNLISSPWQRNRYIGMIHHLKKTPFQYDKSNHMAYYYDDLNITCAYNGFHSLGVGSYYEKGEIQATYFDTRRIYEYVNVEQDLAFVYNKENVLKHLSQKGRSVPEWILEELEARFYGTDYKLLLLYTLLQKKFFLEKE